MQPDLKMFPRTLMGDRRRSFKAACGPSLPISWIPEGAFLLSHTWSDILQGGRTARGGVNLSNFDTLTSPQSADLRTRHTPSRDTSDEDGSYRGNMSALELPTQWEPMHGEVFKKVELQPNSPEYQTVAKGFLNTAKYNIQKIERVQNVYLWHAYTVCRQRIYAKNGPAELGERSLYHGTSAEACSCIEKDRFDRSYAGAHAAAYGKGVYFAVNAEYSARGFSSADTSGLRRLYVARVLTGRYTVGNASMKATPRRATDPTDCFDSLVNNQQQPTIFVIFHDDQAYPEYLITFK